MPSARRFIFDAADARAWAAGGTHADVLRFLGALAGALAGRPLSAAVPASALADALLALLAEARAALAAHPPLPQPMRFGNRAFRGWHAALVARARGAVAALPRVRRSDAAELASHLAGAFGDATRLDYGTGHEAAFLFFLYALGRAGALAEADVPALAARVLPAYFALARAVQRAYGLEPAGSHGVWALDDYAFLPFLLGAAQLAGAGAGGCAAAEGATPAALLGDAGVREALRGDFLYAEAVAGVLESKRGAPVAEHSPVLAELARAASWARVADALGRAYCAEVLGKAPVAQHFLFGPLAPADWAPSRAPAPTDAGAVIDAEEAAEESARAGGAGGAPVEGPAEGGA